MEPIYEWLYDHYAQPRLGRLPPFQDKRVRDALAGETEPGAAGPGVCPGAGLRHRRL